MNRSERKEMDKALRRITGEPPTGVLFARAIGAFVGLLVSVAVSFAIIAVCVWGIVAAFRGVF